MRNYNGVIITEIVFFLPRHPFHAAPFFDKTMEWTRRELRPVNRAGPSDTNSHTASTDQGRKFGSDGATCGTGGTEQDGKGVFEKRVSCVADEYFEFRLPSMTSSLNGRPHLGENTADNRRRAHRTRALEHMIARRQGPGREGQKIDGLHPGASASSLGFRAGVVRGKRGGPEYSRMQVTTNPALAGPKYRVQWRGAENMPGVPERPWGCKAGTADWVGPECLPCLVDRGWEEFATPPTGGPKGRGDFFWRFPVGRALKSRAPFQKQQQEPSLFGRTTL